MGRRPRILAIGEVLWDCFPEGRRLGGAPFNFAYYAAALGADTALVTAVGQDALGDELLARARPEEGFELATQPGWPERSGDKSVPCALHVRRDPKHPTGKVRVCLDSKGVPAFDILRWRAWDFLEWDDDLAALARNADLLYFGTLALRWRVTSMTMEEAVHCTEARLMCDVNLRPPFDDETQVDFGLRHAHIVKLNEAELESVCATYHREGDRREALRGLRSSFGSVLWSVTRGEKGCWLCARHGFVDVPGVPVQVADTVGAGDAFAASLAVDYLAGRNLKTIAENANRLGALVASHPGAIVPWRELAAALDAWRE